MQAASWTGADGTPADDGCTCALSATLGLRTTANPKYLSPYSKRCALFQTLLVSAGVAPGMCFSWSSRLEWAALSWNLQVPGCYCQGSAESWGEDGENIFCCKVQHTVGKNEFSLLLNDD